MRTLIPLAAAALLVAACAPIDNTADPNLTPSQGATSPAAKTAKNGKPKSNFHTVTYRVTGSTSSADISYATASGMEEQNPARVPWHKTFKVRRDDFNMLTITAQNNEDSGTVSCEIDVDGAKVKAAKSSGQFALASCDHTLGGF